MTRPPHRHPHRHPLDDFLLGSTAALDLTEVPLHRDDYGTYATYRDDGDEDVVRIYAATTGDPPAYPVTILGDLGAEFTRDQAVELATALLALARELDATELDRARGERSERR